MSLWIEKKRVIKNEDPKFTGEIVIPEGVEEILPEAFKGSKMTSIRLPGTLKKIGSFAFSDCDNLAAVVFPCSLQTIGESAFYSCNMLREVKFLDGQDSTLRLSVGDMAFAWCNALAKVDFPESLHTIGKQAFCNCTSLEHVFVTDRCATIGEQAFNSCPRLSVVVVPSLTVVCDQGEKCKAQFRRY